MELVMDSGVRNPSCSAVVVESMITSEVRLPGGGNVGAS